MADEKEMSRSKEDELAAKDMLSEGSPPPEQVQEPEHGEELDESVHIEVEEAGDSDDSQAAAMAGEVLIEELRTELAAAQAKADDYLDKLQRTAAEFQNSRRRQERQMAEDIERANGQLIKRLLPVLDDLELAFQNVPEHPASNGDAQSENGGQPEGALVHGFRQIRKKLLDILADQGLEPVDTDGAFDPARHEAIGSEPSDSVESGHIIQVLRSGYMYKGQVLRPALVRVAA
jgi:molecular chaperone GrpE